VPLIYLDAIHGVTTITMKCFVSIFNLKTTFFILPDLSSFYAIIGIDLLKQAGASLCQASGHPNLGTEKEKIDFHSCPDINFTEVDCSDAPPLVRKAFLKMLNLHRNVQCSKKTNWRYRARWKQQHHRTTLLKV